MRHFALAWLRGHAAALLLGCCLAIAAAPRQTAAQPVLRVADQKGLVRALLDASHALDGVPYKIEWSEFAAASPLLQALSADAVDTGIAGDGPFLFAYGAGQNVRATVAVLPREGGHAVAIVVPASSPIHSIQDLAGHSIATTRGSIGHNLLLRVEQTGGVPAAKVSVAYLLPAQAAAALHAGSVDAWATWEPYIAIEEKAGGRRIVDGHALTANYGFQVANTDSIAKKHALLQDFYHRLSHAYDWGNAHPNDYAAIWSRQIGLPLDVSRTVAEEMRTHAAPIDDRIIAAERVTIESYRKGGALAGGSDDIAGAFDRSFAP